MKRGNLTVITLGARVHIPEYPLGYSGIRIFLVFLLIIYVLVFLAYILPFCGL